MQAVSPTRARVKSAEGPMGPIRLHDYVGTSASKSDGPQAFVVEMLQPHARLEAHFHDVDQFQVVVGGDGKLGRYALRPITIHYADAFSPYGPIVAGDAGLSYLTLRLNAAGGFWPMPGSRDKMKTAPGRQFTLEFQPGLDPARAAGTPETLGETFDDGLSVKRLRLAPGQSAGLKIEAGCGAYILVCAGSLRVDSELCGTRSVLLVEPGEVAPKLIAAGEGVDLLITTFPRPSGRIGSRASQMQDYTPPSGLTERHETR